MRYYYACPRCGQVEEFVRVRNGDRGLGCLILVLGGIIPYLILARRHAARVQCPSCLEIFRPPPMPSTGTSKLAVALIALIFLFALFLASVLVIPGPDEGLADVRFLSPVAEAIARHARMVALAVPSFLVLLLVICSGASAVSNHRAHARLRKEFYVVPTALPKRVAPSSRP